MNRKHLVQMIYLKFHKKHYGVTVAKEIELKDALQNMGAARRKTEAEARLRQQRLKIKQEKQAKLEAHQKKLFGTTLD